MNYLTDFETWKERIEALPLSEVKLPNQPVDELTASSETLAKEAGKDMDALIGAGLDMTLIDELPTLSGAVRYCQAVWMSEFNAQQEAQKDWLEESPKAYALRDDILHHFSFAYRNEPKIKTKLSRIKDGTTHADMIQDLIELAVLGDKNPEPLSKINFDVTLTQQARTTSHNMAELLALSNGSKDETSASKILRDKAYTILMNHMSTIREYGKYVFWKDENRKEKYFANYKA